MRKFTKYPSKITASTLPIKDIKLLAKAAVDCTTKDELAEVISGLDSVGLRKLFLHYMEMLRDDSLSVAYIAGQLSDELMSYYVDDIKASTNKPRQVNAATQPPINLKDKIYDLYEIANTWRDDPEIDQILINNGTSPDSRFIVDENTDVMQAYIDLVNYIKDNIDPDVLNEGEYALVYGDDVTACTKVTASEICYRDRDNDDRVVALDAGMPTEDVEKMLAEHPSYYRSTLDRFDGIEGCDKVMAASGIFYTDQGAGIGHRNQVFTEDDLKSAFNSLLAEGDPVATSYDSFEAWRDATLDSGLLSVEFLDEDVDNPDVEFDEIDVDATTKPKYFANMVSASNDPELDDEFLVEGYYDNQRRGLAESAETSDVSSLNELIYDYANKGYYIVVHNLTDGTITEFSADNWFDDLARDGGAGLFMSW